MAHGKLILMYLIVFGPCKLPQIGKGLGKGIRSLNNISAGRIGCVDDQNEEARLKETQIPGLQASCQHLMLQIGAVDIIVYGHCNDIFRDNQLIP